MNVFVRCLFVVIVCLIFSRVHAQEISYFRHDHGVSKGTQALPNDFEQDAKQLWRTPLNKGHSSPCVCGDSIYLTTFQAEEKELATVAIDRATGRIKWKQTVPTKT